MALLATTFGLGSALVSARVEGWTTDEPIHLEWSRRLLETRVTERSSSLHFNSKTPVTMANVAARKLARRVLGVRNPDWLRWFARLPTVACLGALLAVIFLMARALLGPAAACIAATLAAVEPNLIAHGSLATVDVAYALAALLVLWAGLAFAARPSIGRGALLGLALGFAFSAKFTAFLLLPSLLLLPWARPRGTPPRPVAVLGGAAAAVALAILVLCSAYLFRQVATPISEIRWKSATMASLARVAPRLRLPVPADFLTGVDISSASERSKAWPVPVLGQIHRGGVWYYFLLLWLLKTPLALLVLQVGGLVGAVRRGVLAASPPLAYLAVNMVGLLLYLSLLFRAQLGYRYALACVALACLVAAAGLVPLARGSTAPVALGLLVLLAAAEQVPYLGNHVAFSNGLVWPKREAYRLFADSNLDWGQNDDKVDRWLARTGRAGAPVNPVHVLPGENIFSVTTLIADEHRWLRDHARPLGHFRHTYVWFRLEPEEFQRFLAESRRLSGRAQPDARCAAGEPLQPLSSGAPLRVTNEPGRAALLCLSVTATTDVGVQALSGQAQLGLLDRPRRDWEGVRARQVVWYRLDPGFHELVVDAREFTGRWRVEGAPVLFKMMAVPTTKSGVVRPPDPERPGS